MIIIEAKETFGDVCDPLEKGMFSKMSRKDDTMFYATFKGIGDTDIMAFETKQERDDWVNFQDTFSKALGENADNCTFGRKRISAERAEKRIGSMNHIMDYYNPKMHCYFDVLNIF